MRYPSYTLDGDTFWNAKLFYLQERSNSGAWEIDATGPPSGGNHAATSFFWQIRGNGGSAIESGWSYYPYAWDGNWHNHKVYINRTTGTYRFWLDNTLIIDKTYGQIMSTQIYDISFGSIDANTVNVFTRFIDDIEMWDGMPDGSTQPPLADTTPSFVSGLMPSANATNVAINSNIVAHVQDSDSGVASNSITMSVNGQAVSPVISGSAADYTLSYDPPVNFSYSSAVSVTINARDLSGNVMTPYTYSFTTQGAPDVNPPAPPTGVTTTIVQ